MPASAASRVRRLDEYSMRRIPGDKVGFARIDEFKGLENEAVMVVDLPAPARADGYHAAHYVAMSRARSVLSLITGTRPEFSALSAQRSAGCRLTLECFAALRAPDTRR